MTNTFKTFGVSLALVALMGSCQKMDRPALGDYPTDGPRTTLPGDLRFFVPFGGTSPVSRMNMVDSIGKLPAFITNWTIGEGVTGVGAKGADNSGIKYMDANDWAQSKSFTVAFWEKNKVPTGGSPQWLFTLPSKDYWHQTAITAFIDHDGAGSTTSLATVKVILQDQWFEFTNANRMPGNLLNNQWHHMAFVYDQITSKLTYYVDGVALTGLPSNLTDVMKNGAPRGPMDFANTYNFIIGGWNKNVGLPGPTDSWIQSWQGGLDQFRLYNKALSASEIQALYSTKM